jgi:hypothetical protein
MCSVALTANNKRTFGAGKIRGGEEVCLSCFKKINEANPTIAKNLKRYTLAEILGNFEAREKESIETEERKALLDADNEALRTRLEDIKTHIESLGLDDASSLLGLKEINELPEILNTDESIDNIIQGYYNKGRGILVSTNRRLVFIDKGFLYGLKVEDFPLDKITSIQYETGMMLGKVKIHTSGNTAIIENVDKNIARKFAEFIRNKLSEPKPSSIPTIKSEPDVLEQLGKLGKLYESGIISEQEFGEQKKKLLDKL